MMEHLYIIKIRAAVTNSDNLRGCTSSCIVNLSNLRENNRLFRIASLLTTYVLTILIHHQNLCDSLSLNYILDRYQSICVQSWQSKCQSCFYVDFSFIHIAFEFFFIVFCYLQLNDVG